MSLVGTRQCLCCCICLLEPQKVCHCALHLYTLAEADSYRTDSSRAAQILQAVLPSRGASKSDRHMTRPS